MKASRWNQVYIVTQELDSIIDARIGYYEKYRSDMIKLISCHTQKDSYLTLCTPGSCTRPNVPGYIKDACTECRENLRYFHGSIYRKPARIPCVYCDGRAGIDQ